MTRLTSATRAVTARVARWNGLLTWAALAVVVIAHLIIIVSSIANNRLGLDSAYNLTVARNLARGLGYTSDGYFTSHEPDPFDIKISTGPVVLLPASLAYVIGGPDPLILARSIVSLFFVALAVGVWLAGRRVAGRWGGIAALAALLGIHTWATPSIPELQGPSDVLGEYGAAAFAVFALLTLRRRPLLAGLLMGLAVSAKLNAVLFVPAFVVALWLLWDRRADRGGRAVGRRIAAVGLIGAPAAAFELVTLIALGGGGAYIRHIQDLLAFVKAETPARGAGRPDYGVGADVLVESWYGPLFLTAGTTFALLALAIMVVSRRRETWVRDGIAADAELVAFAAFAVVGMATWVLYWMNSSMTYWVRQVITGLVACAPILVAVFIRLARATFHEHRAGPRLERAASILAIAALALLLAWQVKAPVQRAIEADASRLAEEREVAAVMDEAPGNVLLTASDSSVVGQIAFLSDRLIVQVPDESGPRPSGPVLLAGLERDIAGPDGSASPVQRVCVDVLLVTPNYTVCTAR